MKNKKKAQQNDLLVLVGWPVVATILLLIFPVGFLAATILLFGVPATYLSYKNQNAIPRAIVFSAIFSGIGITFFDYFGHMDEAWFVESAFSVRILGQGAIESVIWAFLLTYFIVMFYENFFDHSRHKLIGRRMHYFLPIALAAFVALVLGVLFTGDFPSISYFYLKGGVLFMLIPLVFFLLKFPRFIIKLSVVASYFFLFCLLHEIIALTNGYWHFPGDNFIGWITIGSISFPYEELLFWVFLFSPAVIAYFEFFDDNRLKFKRKKSLRAK